MADVQREPTVDFSIIIPCKTIDHYVERCLKYCKMLDGSYEIIVIPDTACPGYPAAKRNWAMKRAKGEYFAFLDSDAFPPRKWLFWAHFHLGRHAAVCGPGILPLDAPVSERIADWVYINLPYSYRVTQELPRMCAEYPTFNLIVHRDVATEFPDYLTGEDSLFCRKIPEGIFYDPNIFVYHNRRGAFKALWKQVGTYGRHRGNFIMLALVAWITTVFTYSINFIRGFFMRRPS